MIGKIGFVLAGLLLLLDGAFAIKFRLILPDGQIVQGDVEDLVSVTQKHNPGFLEDPAVAIYAKRRMDEIMEDLPNVNIDFKRIGDEEYLDNLNEDMKTIVNTMMQYLTDVYKKGGMELSFYDLPYKRR